MSKKANNNVLFQSYDTCKVPSYFLELTTTGYDENNCSEQNYEHHQQQTYLILSNLGELVYMAPSLVSCSSNEYDDACGRSDRNSTRWTVDLNSVFSNHDEAAGFVDDTWFQCTFVEEIDAVVCLSHKGRIVKVVCNDTILNVTVDHGTSPEIEVVGDFEFGINSASWSPDFDVLLLSINVEGAHEHSSNQINLSRSSALLAMNNMLDVMCEIPTQIMFDESYAPISMSWKGDGSHVTVSSPDSDGIRRIRTYQKEDLQEISMGRMETGADVKNIVDNYDRNVIAWCPNGTIIAAAQITKRTSQIIFFEPCGLRHREFILKVSFCKH